jgi:hypothetical protein
VLGGGWTAEWAGSQGSQAANASLFGRAGVRGWRPRSDESGLVAEMLHVKLVKPPALGRHSRRRGSLGGRQTHEKDVAESQMHLMTKTGRHKLQPSRHWW